MGLIKNKLHLILIVLILLAVSGHYIWHLDSNTDYAPDQPIPFSHKIHAGDYKMDCPLLSRRCGERSACRYSADECLHRMPFGRWAG